MTLEWMLIICAGLLLVSVLMSKVSDRSGVPALILFLAIGMLAGSDGPGGIYFDDPQLTQNIGVIALNLILFAGGLDTRWKDVRLIVKHGIALSTLGVFTTAMIVGITAQYLLGFTPLQGLLLGAIVSSTDAAAVFSILRSKGLGLKGKLLPLLEFESGSNDPMAVFLTVGLIQLITHPATQVTTLLGALVLQILVGILSGYLFGRLLVFLANRVQLGFEGLYPVLSLSIVFLAYSLTSILYGNGFLAVYLVGIVAGHYDFLHRRSVMRFHDGIAWLMQITMFLTLGLLVFPSRILPIISTGLLVAASLVFLARPISIFLTLLPTSFSLKEKVFISWVGLRGAVPIILATYPLLVGLSQADEIFNIVFFVVLMSAMLQGTTIPMVAKWLGVGETLAAKPAFPIEFNPVSGFKNELKEIIIAAESMAEGKSIVELGLPQAFLVILIARENEFLMPSGGFVLQAGDTLIVLADRETFNMVDQQLKEPYIPQ